MKGCLRALAFFLLFIFSLCVTFYLYERWQRIGKEVVVVMRSSNEDCDEFRCIWKIDRVVQGNLNFKDATSSCYLVRSKREYSKRDEVEWIKVQGVFTHEESHAYSIGCRGTLLFRDETVSRIAVGKRKQR